MFPTLLALALLPDAAALTKVKSGRIIQNTTTNAGDIVRVVTDDDAAIAGVTATLASDGGDERVPLVASDAWLHGGATLAALPTGGATVAVTVHDAGSAPIATFTATLSERLGWSAWTTTVHANDVAGKPTMPDVEVLAAAIHAADGGYTVALDFAGADVPDVAYADLTIVERVRCEARGCTAETTTKTTKAEVDLDDVGLIWEGALASAHEGVTTLSVTAADARGGTLDTFRAEVVRAWDDGGAGAPALPADADPLTSVALVAHYGADRFAGGHVRGLRTALTVVSDGWALGGTLPTYAEITLAGGEVLEVPANSYQVAAVVPIAFKGDPEKERFKVTVDGATVSAAEVVGRRGMCQYGKCFSLAADTGGTWRLSVTAYATTASALPSRVEVSLEGAYGAATPTQATYTLTFDPVVAVVFAAETTFAGDPAGLDLSGRVRLRGRQTLLVGAFEGRLGVDEDGDVALSALDHTDTVASRGDILIGGEPIGLESVDPETGATVATAPPAVVLRASANGTGTRVASASTSQTQQTQLL